MNMTLLVCVGLAGWPPIPQQAELTRLRNEALVKRAFQHREPIERLQASVDLQIAEERAFSLKFRIDLDESQLAWRAEGFSTAPPTQDQLGQQIRENQCLLVRQKQWLAGLEWAAVQRKQQQWLVNERVVVEMLQRLHEELWPIAPMPREVGR